MAPDRRRISAPPARARPAGGAVPGRLYAIREVARACGLTAETLRIWERRYGRPAPVRRPSGHRRYVEADVRWLRRVAEALARGHRPAEVLELDDAALDRLLAADPGAPRAAAAQEEWVALVRGFEAPRLRSALLARWAAEPPLRFLEQTLAPMIEALGAGWADGWLDVRHEHFASEVIEALLAELRAGLVAPPGRPRVLLCTLPGETHALGLGLAETLCAVRGVAWRRLGVNAPLPEIAAAARETRAAVVALSISLATGGVDTDRTLRDLRGRLPAAVRLVVGGAGARSARRGPRGVERVATLARWDALLADL